MSVLKDKNILLGVSGGIAAYKSITLLRLLKKNGAKSVYSYTTHGVLSKPAVERINNSPIDKMIITDSIQANDEVKKSSKIEQITIAPLIGEAINRISDNRSVSSLFA